jgi:hypothetical protein
MQFEYSTDDSQKSLAPFFSAKMLSITSSGLLILCLILFVCWPTKDLHFYVGGPEIPLSFLVIFGAALLLNAYVNLRCGHGEIFIASIPSRPMRDKLVTYEEEREFFSYGLIEFILHTLFLLAILLPPLLVSAALSQTATTIWVKSLSIIFVASLFCRLFGFMMFLALRNHPMIGYQSTRLFFLLFIVGTALFAPFTNSYLMINALYRGQEWIAPLSMDVYTLHMLIMTLAIMFLTLANQLMVRHNRIKRKAT